MFRLDLSLYVSAEIKIWNFELYTKQELKWPVARTFEHGGELKEHADPAAEREDIDAADVGAVEEHGAGGGLPEAVERAEERGLAAAAGPDDAHDDAARDVQVDAPQDLVARRPVRQAAQPAHPYLGRRRAAAAAGGAVHVQQQVLPESIIT